MPLLRCPWVLLVAASVLVGKHGATSSTSRTLDNNSIITAPEATSQVGKHSVTSSTSRTLDNNSITTTPEETSQADAVHSDYTVATLLSSSGANIHQYETQAITTQQPDSASTAALTTLNYSEGTDGPAREDWYNNAARDVTIYGYGLVVGLGLITNTLTMVTTTRPGLRQSALAVYLFALAVADTVVLLLSFLNIWLRTVTGLHLIHIEGFCQVHSYFFDASYTCSAWYVVIMACERAIVVWSPLKAIYLCTRKAALIASCTLPVVVFAFFSYVPFAWHIRDGACVARDRFEYFMTYVNPNMTGTLYSYIPLCLIGLSTVVIILGICRAQMRRDDIASETASNTQRACVIVVMICIFYLLFSVPVALWYMFVFSEGIYRNSPAKLAFIESLIQVWGALNHATNFFFYVLSAGSFRQEFCQWCGCLQSQYKTN